MAVFLRCSAFLGVIYFLINLKMGNANCNVDYYQYFSVEDNSYYSGRGLYCQNIQPPLNEYNYQCGECRRMTISNSTIPEIITGAFSNTLSRLELQLSGNFIKNVQPGAFSDLEYLEELDLHNNQIVKISNGIFNSLVQLKSLDLSKNKISSIDPNFLTGVIHISSLNLAENALKSVDDIFLIQNSHFIMLNLSSNEISSINLNRYNGEINTLDISNNKLTSVNVCFPGLKNLIASNNEIKYLFDDTCSLDAGLITLDVSNNLLNEENIMNVSKLFKLERLNLAGNNLSFISVNLFCNLTTKNVIPGPFSGFQGLEELDLQNNQVAKIPTGIFNHLVRLKSLDLSRNKISSIDPNFLTGVTHMSSLNLAENALKSVDDIFLIQNFYFIMLNLSSNEISSINLNRFNGKINTLDISNNKLSSVNVCFPGLKNLNASNNEIKYLFADTCSLDAALITLDVGNNLLNEENVMNVSKLSKLEKLNLARNILSFIPVNLFVNLTHLIYLNMSHNEISYLNYGALDHVKELQVLDLSYNKITTLKRYLHFLSVLRYLYINNNKITNINSKQLLNDIGQLNTINIDSNNFTCENLVEAIHDFRDRVFKGTATTGSNIHGIACKEETVPEANPEVKLKADIIKYLETIISAKLEKSENLQFDRSFMYDYFNKDFKSSNFYKYLEGLKNINTLNLNGTDMLMYFNQDFKNSLFYKYLESLKANENSTREFNKSLYGYLNKDFNGAYLDKYLTKLEKFKDEFIDSFENSSIFNYLNKGFENSTFYKYLENLNSKFDCIQQKDHGTAEYFRSSGQQINNYSALLSMLSVIIVLLIILVVFKAVQIYFNYNKKSIFFREQVELLDTNSIQ